MVTKRSSKLRIWKLARDEDRHAVQRDALAAQAVDVLGGEARLLVVVPDAAHGELAAVARVGVQGLAEAAEIVRDQLRGRAEDMARGAVILLQPDHMRAGEILLEAQDVVHFRAAPAVDGLVVVADATDVVVPLCEQPQPEILRDVRVLVLVHEDVGEPAVILA